MDSYEMGRIDGRDEMRGLKDEEIERLKKEREHSRDWMAAIKALVIEQANDEGIWFIAQTVSEEYLQQELRKLHSMIEMAE